MGVDRVLTAKLWRIKTRIEQYPTIFNHRDSPSNAVFPSYQSKTQKQRAKPADTVEADTEMLQAEMEALHALNKKAEKENAAEMEALIAAEEKDAAVDKRTRGLSTYHRDMLKLSRKNDRQCARVLTNWKTIDCNTNEYGGGRPPSLLALSGRTTERGAGERFAKALFNGYSQIEGVNADPSPAP